jgi:putative ABC transport system permease protein
MRGLLPYAWRGLVARPARTILTILGIAVGVGALVAALAVNAGLETSIDRTVTSLVGRADLRVAAFTDAGLSDATLTALDAVPGVALTAPAIERRSFLSSEPGRPPATQPVTVLGIDPSREPRVRDLVVARGAPLEAGSGDVALITETLAASEGLDIGSELSILGAGAPVKVRVAGLLAGDGPALGSSGRTLIVPIMTARRLALADGAASATDARLAGITRVDVVLAAGADSGTVTAEIGRALTSEPYVLSVPRDIAESMRASTADIRSTMALLASIALFAAAFLILNTLAMTVVERVRELGLLRAAGAGRGQVVRIVVAQALVLGVAGSMVGVALGVVLASLLAGLLRAAGTVDIVAPDASPTVLLTGLAAGVLVTLVAGLEPARRAASISPMTTLRARGDPAAAVRSHLGWLVTVMSVVAVVAMLLLPAGGASALGPARSPAIYAILMLAVLAIPLLLGPLGRIAGLPFSVAFRLEERLARAAIARDRARTTITVGALVVGLAMVVAMALVGSNARVTATAWLADVVPGDEILTAIAPAPVGDGGVDSQLAAIPGVGLATPIASFDLAFRGTRLEATAIRGADFARDGRLTFTAGDRASALAALDAGGSVILSRARAERLGVGLGDMLTVATASGSRDLRVAGIVERSFPGRSGETALVGWTDAVSGFGVTGADALAVRYLDGRRAEAAPAVAALAAQEALTVAPISQVEGAVGDALDRVFGLLDMLALAAVVIAALGIVNTLSMDTWERTRELGMLRAAGMSRRQVWRGVVVEAGILGGIGSLVGVMAGLAIGALLVTTSGGRLEVPIRVPWPTLLLALVAGAVLAMAASAQPARIAGRRSIVSAVRSE